MNHHDWTLLSAVNWAIPNLQSCLEREAHQIQWEYQPGQSMSPGRRNSPWKQMVFHTSLITSQDDSQTKLETDSVSISLPLPFFSSFSSTHLPLSSSVVPFPTSDQLLSIFFVRSHTTYFASSCNTTFNHNTLSTPELLQLLLYCPHILLICSHLCTANWSNDHQNVRRSPKNSHIWLHRTMLHQLFPLFEVLVPFQKWNTTETKHKINIMTTFFYTHECLNKVQRINPIRDIAWIQVCHIWRHLHIYTYYYSMWLGGLF